MEANPDVTPIVRRAGRACFGGEVSGLADHRSDREVVRASSRLGPISVNEQELVHTVSGRRQKVPVEPQRVAIPCVQTSDRPTAHLSHLVRDRDTRDRRSANVVVRDEEPRGDGVEHANLVTNPT